MENNSHLLTFVIPMYNASRTIHRCLDSIYSLPLKEDDIEVIVVDDCSTDNAVELVRDYQKEHASLTLFCQLQNHRQGAARNIGEEKASGDFIVFVDSDDEVDSGLIQAVNLATSKDLDMVAIRVSRVSGDGIVESEMSLPYQMDKVFAGIELQTEHPYWGTAPWAYIYRRSFLKETNYRFAEDVLFEDSDFVNVHLYSAKRMAYSDVCGYRAHFNVNSTTHTMSYKHLADYALLGSRMLAFYESLPNKTTKYAEGILEGGSYNVMMAFRKIWRLHSVIEIRDFYDRLETRCDLKSMLVYRKPSYCWTKWTRICLKYHRLVTLVVGLAIPVLKIKTKTKTRNCYICQQR